MKGRQLYLGMRLSKALVVKQGPTLAWMECQDQCDTSIRLHSYGLGGVGGAANIVLLGGALILTHVESMLATDVLEFRFLGDTNQTITPCILYKVG